MVESLKRWNGGRTPGRLNTIVGGGFHFLTIQRFNDSTTSQNSYIMPDARRTKPHVEVGERHPEETQPRPKHMAAIETAHAAVGLLAKRRSGEPVYAAANQMTKR